MRAPPAAGGAGTSEARSRRRLPSDASPRPDAPASRAPLTRRCGLGFRSCSSVLEAWTGASRGGELLEAHLRDGLSPDRQHDRPSGRGAVADVVAGSNAEGVRAAQPGVVEMRYELAPGESRGQSGPASRSRRGHLNRSSSDTRLAVTRIDDDPGRVVRVHGLQAHRRWGLVDVNRHRTGSGVMVALRVDRVVPGGAGNRSHPVAVDC